MRGKVRACEGCGREFKGELRLCWKCRATERTCAACGKEFKGNQRMCDACTRIERACEGCGKTFKDHRRLCRICSTGERPCESCGRVFKSQSRTCDTCRRIKRACVDCGKTFRGRKSQGQCGACRATARTCANCCREFTGNQPRCWRCQWAERPPQERAARNRSQNHARRARRATAEVMGPVHAEVYAAIRASGSCVYCGAPSEHVDHVRPLAKGGWEHESNLVPACKTCNSSKGPRLLTEWNPARVAHAAACSPIVAAEWARLTGVAATWAPNPT